MFLAGCTGNSQFTNYENKGNLVAKNPLSCVNTAEVGSEGTAADITAGAKEYAVLSMYNEAAEFIMIADGMSAFTGSIKKPLTQDLNAKLQCNYCMVKIISIR